MGKAKWTATDKKCEECNSNMVKLRANVYICAQCGLEQHRVVKRTEARITNDKYNF